MGLREIITNNWPNPLSVPPSPSQAPREYLFHHTDGSLDMTDFKLSYRNLALRFFVDKSRHQLMPTNTMRLRCLSQIENFFSAHRETMQIVSIRKSQFDMLNQKLTNHRTIHGGGAAAMKSSQLYSSHLVMTILCLVFVQLPFVVAQTVPRTR